MTGLWLEHCQACSVPEIAGVFNRSGIAYNMVTGYLNDLDVWREINKWVKAAWVATAMRNHRMGVLGHYYGGMLDVYTDLTRLSASFGTHFEILEMCELKKIRDVVTEEMVSDKITEFKEVFEVSVECDAKETERVV